MWLTFGISLSGNWGVDLQAGSQFGYHLLFVILVSGILAAFLQVLLIIFSSVDLVLMEFRFYIGVGKQTWLRYWSR